MPNLIGTAPNQVPTNGSLGNMAFQNKEAVSVDLLVTVTLTATNATYTGTLTGGSGIVNLGSGQFYKDASGNVGIGTTTPAAKFDVTSTTSGFLPPRMSTTQRDAISSPPDGSVIYNNTTGTLQVRQNGQWVSPSTAGVVNVSASLDLDFINEFYSARRTAKTFNQLIDFTRTSAATYVDATGKIVSTPASRNLLTFTQEFDNAVWSKSSTDITANSISAPDGTMTADTLTAGAGAGSGQQIYQLLTNIGTGTFVYSVYVKQGSGATDSNKFAVYNQTASADYARITVNYSTGVVTQIVGSGASMTAVGDGWWRLSVPFTSTATLGNSIRFFVGSTGAVGTPGEFIYAWGAQLEAGSAATDYTRNFGGVYPPRFDYDPVTLAPRGLLVEEQRTNLLLRSKEFDNAFWQKTNITVTSAATVSPDGTTNAQRIAATASAATNILSTNAAVAATSATYSVYVKQGTGPTTANSFAIRNNTTATTLLLVTVNLATGTVISYINGTTGASLQNAGNGWWRVVLTVTSGVTSGDLLSGYVGFVGGLHTAGDHLFAWGAQLEAGAFATSYIPCVASQVTRTADSAVIQTPNFASWYNQTEGTFVAEFDTISTLLASSALSVDDATNNNFIRVGRVNTTGRLRVLNGGASQADVLPANAPGWAGVVKIAAAFKVNDFAASVSGGTVATGTSGTIPAVTQLRLGASGGGDPINGHIRSIRYYPTRLSNAQLQALTT